MDKGLQVTFHVFCAVTTSLLFLPSHATARTPVAPKKRPEDSLPKSNPGVVGLKIKINSEHLPVVATAFPGSPAAEAGIRPGDVILKIDGNDTINLDTAKIYAMLTGEANTKVILKIRKGSPVFYKQLSRMPVSAFVKLHPELSEQYQKESAAFKKMQQSAH